METEYKSGFKYTEGTPYVALMGELWGVFCGDFGESWPRYNRIVLYLVR